MVTTAYDYITLAELELYAGYDFSAWDAVKFHDDIFVTDLSWLEEFATKYPKKIGLPFCDFGNPTSLVKYRDRSFASPDYSRFALSMNSLF